MRNLQNLGDVLLRIAMLADPHSLVVRHPMRVADDAFAVNDKTGRAGRTLRLLLPLAKNTSTWIHKRDSARTSIVRDRSVQVGLGMD